MGLKDRGLIKLKYLSGNSTTPDVAGGVPLKIFSAENRDTLEKDITYIAIPQAGSDSWIEGDDVTALDLLENKDTWAITGQIYNERDGKSTVPDSIKDGNGDGEVTGETLSFNSFGNRSSVQSFDETGEIISVHGDVTSEPSLSSGSTFEVHNSSSNNGEYTVSSTSYDSGNNETDITVNEDVVAETASGDEWIEWGSSHSWHLMGATGIINGSVTVTDSQSNTLNEGSDYNIDYNKGLIEVFNSGTVDVTDGSPDEVLTADYKFDTRNDNVARIVKRMGQRGGAAILEEDPKTYSQESRSIVTVDTVNDLFSVSGFHTGDYNTGDQVEVSGSTGNDGTYEVSSVSYDSGNNETDISVVEQVNDSTADGNLTKREGKKSMVQINTFEITENTTNPNNIEVSIEMRQALDRAV